MAEKKPNADDTAGPLAELRDRVERATKLIGELREANYSLTSEIAELHRKLGALLADYRLARPAEPTVTMSI